MVRLFGVLMGVATSLGPVGVAWGQTPTPLEVRVTETEARKLFFLALEAIQGKQWAQAERHLRASFAAVERPSTLYNLALVVYKQGRLRESLRLARDLLDGSAGPPDAKYRAYGQQLVERTLSELPRIEVHVRPEDARIAVDGEVVEGSGARRTLMVDPGRRQVSVEREGYRKEDATLVLAAGDRRQIDLLLEPRKSLSSAKSDGARAAPPALPIERDVRSEPSSTGIVPWILVGTGSALLGGSLVTGIFAANANADFKDRCPTLEQCDPELRATQDRARSFGLATDVLLVSGGVLALGGVAWWLLAPTPSSAAGPSITAEISRRHAALRVGSPF